MHKIILIICAVFYAIGVSASTTRNEAIEILTMTQECINVVEGCQKVLSDSASLNEKGACLITNLYPLAEKGNYMAYGLIAETQAKIGNHEEALKWYKNLMQIDTVPAQIKQEFQQDMEVLERTLQSKQKPEMAPPAVQGN